MINMLRVLFVVLVVCSHPCSANEINKIDYDHALWLSAIMQDNGDKLEHLKKNVRANSISQILKVLDDLSSSHWDSSIGSKISIVEFQILCAFLAQFQCSDSRITNDHRATIHQNDSLIKTDRYSYPSVKYLPAQSNGGISLSADTGSMAMSIYGSSKDLMSNGFPAVGPDGQGLLLCRVNKHSQADFFEVPHTTAQSMYKLLSNDMSIQTDCFDNRSISDYWQRRLSTFVYPNGMDRFSMGSSREN